MPPQPRFGRSPEPRGHANPLTAEVLISHARACEAAGFGQQSNCIIEATALIGPSFRRLLPDPVSDMLSRAQGHAMAGAYESAVLALMPNSATYTGGRMGDGTVIAQVVLGAGASAHSREARWLAMAWLAALLRAIAGQLEASEQARPTK